MHPGPWNNTGVTRRRFLRTAAWISLGAPLFPACSGPSPSLRRGTRSDQRLRHACIGLGGIGAADVAFFSGHPRVRLTALCDVDSIYLDQAAPLAPEATRYTDYRQMLKVEGPRLDSVSVAVPAHMHFAICAAALKAGKNVCCHGPFGHNIQEGRALRRLADQSGLVIALNPQLSRNPNLTAASQSLKEGRVGLVTHVYLGTSTPVAHSLRIRRPPPVAPGPPPDNLDWNLWLGTAPVRPYLPGEFHPKRWRAWMDFGIGPAVDDAQMLLQAIWRGLKLGPPQTVAAEPDPEWESLGARQAGLWPAGSHVSWTFPGEEGIAGEELAVDWYDGEFRIPERIQKLTGTGAGPVPPLAAIVLGTEGTLLASPSQPPRLTHRLVPAELTGPEVGPVNSYQQYVDACLGTEASPGGLEESLAISETLLLSNIAWRFPGVSLRWNNEAAEFPGHPEANGFLSRVYRDGWHIGPF